MAKKNHECTMAMPHTHDEHPDTAAAAIISMLQEHGGRVILTIHDFDALYTSVLLRRGRPVWVERTLCSPEHDPEALVLAGGGIMIENNLRAPANGADWGFLRRTVRNAARAVCVPLLRGHTVFGAATLVRTAGEKPFTPAAAEKFRTAVHAARHTVCRMTTLRPWIKKAAHLESLIRVSALISSSLEPDEILDSVLRTAAELTHAEAGSLLLLGDNKNTLLFKYTTGDYSEKVKRFTLDLGRGIAGWVALNGKPLLVPDVSRDARFDPTIAQAIGFSTRSILCVPVRTHDTILGALEVINKKNRRECFDGTDMETLDAIARQAAVAVENARLYTQAMTDTLTGLYSRAYIDNFSRREIQGSRRTGRPVSLLVADVDHFKKFNDRHGHQAGDAALAAVAGAIRTGLRATDVAARYGGEEFLVVLPDTDTRSAERVARRICERIQNLKLSNGCKSPTISFGAAACPVHADNFEQLFYLADKALYTAKRRGGNRVCAADA